MHRLINLFVKAAAAELSLPAPVLEVGALQVPGQEDIANLRPYFAASQYAGDQYIGTDMRPGPGVDRVEDVRHLSFGDASIGTVLMMETLEHVAEPQRALSEVRRTLRADGVLIMSTPFAIEIHNHPNDFWRFTPEAYNLLLEPLGAHLIGAVGPARDPLFVFGVAFRGGEPAMLRERCAAVVTRYRAALQKDAQTVRELRRYKWEHRLTALLPIQEIRRFYRSRPHMFDTRFRFHAGATVHDFT